MGFIRPAIAFLIIIFAACPLAAQNIGATMEGTDH